MSYNKHLYKFIASLVTVGLLILLAMGSGGSDGGSSTSSTSSVSGEKTITGSSYVGCSSKHDINKLTDLVSQNDKAAYKKYLSSRLSTGACIMFKQGETVHVMDRNISGLVKVRKKGETNSYWTYVEAVQ